MLTNTSSMCIAVVLAAASTITLTGNASAAPPCGKHDDITKALTSKYQESRRAMGVIQQQAVMEIFMSPKGSWTLLVTGIDGNTCIMAAGQDWLEMPLVVAGRES